MQHLKHRGSISRSSRARRSIVSRHSRDMLNAACCETLEQRRLLAADVPNDFVKLNTSPIVVGTESAAPVSTGITLAAGENFYFVASGSHQLATNRRGGWLCGRNL